MPIKRVIKSLKRRSKIKGRIRDLINPIILFITFKISRAETVSIDDHKFKNVIELIKSQFELDKEIMIASEVWRDPLKSRLNIISESIKNNNLIELRKLYEQLYKSDLMEGAVSHEEGMSLMQRISQGTRFYRRHKIIEDSLKKYKKPFIEKVKKHIYSKNYNYGRPLVCNFKSPINIEYPDELYFALFIAEIIDKYNYEEITFIGDGSGLLASTIIFINKEVYNNNQSKYRILDFAHFAIATLLRINSNDINIQVSLPEAVHKIKENIISEGHLPKINGDRLIINQDSFPEMSYTSLKTYLNNSARNTDIVSYNQRAGYNYKHCDHIAVIKDLGYKLILEKNSKLRDGYFLSHYTSSKD